MSLKRNEECRFCKLYVALVDMCVPSGHLQYLHVFLKAISHLGDELVFGHKTFVSNQIGFSSIPPMNCFKLLIHKNEQIATRLGMTCVFRNFSSGSPLTLK